MKKKIEFLKTLTLTNNVPSLNKTSSLASESPPGTSNKNTFNKITILLKITKFLNMSSKDTT